MGRPIPTWVLHFTHADDLPAIVRHGLRADTEILKLGAPVVDIGNQDIKSRRRQQRVDTDPFGVVADYVPFYFAPRSPMM